MRILNKPLTMFVIDYKKKYQMSYIFLNYMSDRNFERPYQINLMNSETVRYY